MGEYAAREERTRETGDVRGGVDEKVFRTIEYADFWRKETVAGILSEPSDPAVLMSAGAAAGTARRLWPAVALVLFLRRIMRYRAFIRHLEAGSTEISDLRTWKLFSDCQKNCGPEPASFLSAEMKMSEIYNTAIPGYRMLKENER